MKRFFFLPLLCVPLLLFSACGEPPTVQSDFSALFTTTHGDMCYAGTVTKDDESITVTMSEPHTVQGMAFCWEDGSLAVRCSGLSTLANADYLPADSIPAALHNTLAYLPQASYTDSENDEDHFTLPTPYGDAELIAQNGIPQSLTDPHSKAIFYFE